ncbi:MAG: inositol monophosphatase [Alphaproteobacteria bacterium]|nr:inositol monophosphatase [Alphaproteobacteria bacterium]
MHSPDLHQVAEIIKTISEQEVLPRFNHLSVSDVDTKNSSEDYVTTADTQTEKRLTAELTALLPEALVVGEEAAFRDPAVLNCLKAEQPVWVIDPIDGTMNFAYGRSEIGVVVALVYKGETVAGWLYNPVFKRMIMGEKGSGAWYEGKRLKVAEVKEFYQMTGSVGRRVAFKDSRLPQPAWWGSASFGYMMIISGGAHYSAYRSKIIKPWDHAAGIMLHAEAGGYTAYVDGTDYTPFVGANHLISAPNKDAWAYLRDNMCAKAA